MTCAELPLRDVELLPEGARCASRESCGAGAMTELRPMLRSPSRRVEADSAVGGGAITADGA
jgi:hypothetical protein